MLVAVKSVEFLMTFARGTVKGRTRMNLHVIIPTLNRPTEVEEILWELHPAFLDPRVRVTVVDDASRDDVVETLHGVAEEFPDVSFIFLNRNMGAAAARNVGAFSVPSEWLWFIDDDDRVTGQTILGVLDQLESIPDSLVMLSAYFHSGEVVTLVVPEGRDLFRRLSRFGNQVNTSCAVVRYSLFREIGGWDERLIAGQDTDLLLRLSEKTDALVLREYFVDVIHHDGQRITTDSTKQMIGKLQFIIKNWRRLHWLRLTRYVVSVGFFYPYLRKLRITAKAHG